MSVIEALQQLLGTTWIPFFIWITQLGQEKAYMVVLSLYFWLVSPRQARQIGLLLVLSALSNGILKEMFALPRPYVVNPQVKTIEALATAGSYSFPSGHAQGITTFWGAIASLQGRIWVWIVALVMIALVCISRMYLGVHYPTDVIAGIFLGIFWVTLGLWIGRVEERPKYNLAGKIVFWVVGGMAAIALPVFAPLLGIFFGFFPVMSVKHQPPQDWSGRIILGLGGFAGLIAVYLALKQIALLFPVWGVIDYLRYLAIALTVTEGIPWLWQRSQPLR